MMCDRDNSDTERDSGRGWRISPSDAERWFPVVIVIVMMLTQRADPWSRGQQTAEHFLSLTVTSAPADPPGDRRGLNTSKTTSGFDFMVYYKCSSEIRIIQDKYNLWFSE